MNKIGLVIQGPLLSIGRTGDKMRLSVEELKAEGGIVEYDCRENIQKIIQTYGHLFEEIVISTWDNEVKPADGWEGAKLVSQPDPGGIKQEGHYKDNNKHRQFLSTLKGLKELEKSGIEYAIKTRTDIWIDLEKVINSYFERIEKMENKDAIGATVVHPPTFLLHDLYFMSTTRAMIDFSEAILGHNRFEFIASVHREIVLKPAYDIYRGEIGVPEWAYFPIYPPTGVNKETRKIFDYMFRNVFFDLNPEVFRGTLWRGTYFPKDHVSALVDHKEKNRKFNIPTIISTDWDRYFHFLLQGEGRKISFLDRVLVQMGKLGWKLWGFIRTVRNKLS